MGYICIECGENVTVDEITQRTRCPYCGGKVLFKARSGIARTVKAK